MYLKAIEAALSGQQKHESIRSIVRELSAHMGEDSFKIVDNWDADLVAVGVCSMHEPGMAAYISTWDRPPGRCYLELEWPAENSADLPYGKTEEFENVSCSEAVSISAKHIGRRTDQID